MSYPQKRVNTYTALKQGCEKTAVLQKSYISKILYNTQIEKPGAFLAIG